MYGNAFGCTKNCGDTISSVRFENRSVPEATEKMLITTAGIDIYIFCTLHYGAQTKLLTKMTLVFLMFEQYCFLMYFVLKKIQLLNYVSGIIYTLHTYLYNV